MLRQAVGRSVTMAGAVSCVLCLAAAGWAADPVLPDDPAHLDELAADLQKASNELCWELHKYHQQQPDFKEIYRTAKDLWSLSGAYRDALRAGDTPAMADQIARMNDLYNKVQAVTAKWGDGVIPATDAPPDEKVVVVPGSRVNVDVPLLFGGIHIGRPSQVVVAEPRPPALPRRRPHPHAHGSKRSLEREMFATQVALQYLNEDALPAAGEEPKPAPPPTPDAAVPGTAPSATPGPTLGEPVRISPPPKK